MIKDELVDLEDIAASEVVVVKVGEQLTATILDANVGEVLDTIGEERVRKYFGIGEEI